MNRLDWYERVANMILDELERFYDTFYKGKKLVPVGSSFRLEPCPKCGHKGCCTIDSAVHCFSCGWAATHINALMDYMIEKEGKTKREVIKMLEEFTDLPYPKGFNKEEAEKAAKYERLQEIKNIASKYYADKLMSENTRYDYKDKSGVVKKVTPLEYQLAIRKHSTDTLKAFGVGFVSNYLELWNMLIDMGYDKEEIKAAKIWFPEGVFVYTVFHPVTRDIMRMNIKNPFNITMPSQKDGKEEIIQGMSAGDKFIGFAPGFNFNKPAIVVEGENDAQTVYGRNFKNVCWIAGNIKPEQLEILDKMNAPIYLCYDNDAVGRKYTEMTDEVLPHKDLRLMSFDDTYNDIDDYYRTHPSPKTIEELIDEAKQIETEAFKIMHEDNLWIIANRHKRIEFTITGKDSNDKITGRIDYFVDGILRDREEDKPLHKCRNNKRPFNFYLSDRMEQYFNNDLDQRTFEELVNIYTYCSHKSQVIKLLAKHLYEKQMAESLVYHIRAALGNNVADAVLKEVNDLQNIDALKNCNIIPRIKISQYFNTTNNDAYFYFTAVKKDGDAVRSLPYLFRNDKGLIRLDLLKRKDSQCLLLIDNKYELPYEVNETCIDIRECSLTQEWVMAHIDGNIPKSEINPYNLLRTIESYLKRFYYHNDENVYKMLALYVYGTYFYELFGQYPYLFLTGEKGSGKSILDTVLYMFCLNAKLAINITEAALFRMISVQGGTMIIDEMENLTSIKNTADSGMAAILKGGYARGALVYRFNTETGRDEGFDPFCPKVISNILGLEDIIEDRCIRISTFRLNVGEHKIEDPKKYLAERMGEIREVTSKCAISALEYFQIVNVLYAKTQFVTSNARLSQILNPIYALAAFADAMRDNPNLTLEDAEKININKPIGEYMKSFNDFYTNVIVKIKKDIEENTPEGILKHIVRTTAAEILDLIPSNDKEYTVTSNHKYTEAINYDIDEGWFEINIAHFKCFIEENMPGETAYTRTIHKWVKSAFNLEMDDIKRKTITVENEELLKEFKGNHKPKVYHYRFRFKNFVDNKNNFLDNNKSKQVAKQTISDKELQDNLF